MNLTNTLFGVCCMERYWPGVHHRKERVPVWDWRNVAEKASPASWSHTLQNQIPEVPDPVV